MLEGISELVESSGSQTSVCVSSPRGLSIAQLAGFPASTPLIQEVRPGNMHSNMFPGDADVADLGAIL